MPSMRADAASKRCALSRCLFFNARSLLEPKLPLQLDRLPLAPRAMSRRLTPHGMRRSTRATRKTLPRHTCQMQSYCGRPTRWWRVQRRSRSFLPGARPRRNGPQTKGDRRGGDDKIVNGTANWSAIGQGQGLVSLRAYPVDDAGVYPTPCWPRARPASA
jgi:hypothetical protein